MISAGVVAAIHLAGVRGEPCGAGTVYIYIYIYMELQSIVNDCFKNFVCWPVI